MNASQIILQGTVRPDGTLELPGKLNLPPGQVRVTVEVMNSPEATSEDWFHYLRRARAERESQGASFRSREEIDAEINMLRDEWDQPGPSRE